MSITTSAPPRAECRVDLAAYRSNIRQLAAGLHGSAELWAVVKADAYGHGVTRVAQEAVAAGARRLCVATLSEARQLRQAGMRVPVLIMGPLDRPGIARAIELDVAVSVLSMPMLGDIEAVARHLPARGPGASLHLKVDTGMGRWGVPMAEVDDALGRLVSLAAVDVDGVMTHFATADDAADDGFFELQLGRFERIVEHVRGEVDGVRFHAANSAATLREPRSHFDAVRCGVATYGLDPMQRSANALELQPVLSLRSYVADIRHRAAGESVGYCRSFIADEPTRLAIVPLGYADGVRRALSNVGAVVIGGRRCPIVGTISMDQLAVRVGEHVAIGDVVTVIGRDGDECITAEDHARWTSSINYEVTCGVASEPRLLRTFTAG